MSFRDQFSQACQRLGVEPSRIMPSYEILFEIVPPPGSAELAFAFGVASFEHLSDLCLYSLELDNDMVGGQFASQSGFSFDSSAPA